MPKSKRDKRISLTKTDKKGLERKQNLIEEIRKSLDLYDRIFLFNVHNMRSSHMKDVRKSWDHSRFFFGKNKVMAIALGKTAESEMMDNLHKMSAKLTNEVGLLFTNKSEKYVVDWFAKYSKFDYARSGSEATSTVELEEGPLHQFSHSIEPHLRKLGLPVTLKKGIVTMLRKHTICKEGEILSPEQADILKLLKIVLSEFSIGLECGWDKESGKLTEFDNKQKDKAFNVVRVSADDQEYDYVEKENTPNQDATEKMEIVPAVQTDMPKIDETLKVVQLSEDQNCDNIEKGNSPEKEKSKKMKTAPPTSQTDTPKKEDVDNKYKRMLRPRKNKPA